MLYDGDMKSTVLICALHVVLNSPTRTIYIMKMLMQVGYIPYTYVMDCCIKMECFSLCIVASRVECI